MRLRRSAKCYRQVKLRNCLNSAWLFEKTIFITMRGVIVSDTNSYEGDNGVIESESGYVI